MLSSKIKKELIQSRNRLIDSKMWPKRLTGACNVSSLIVYSILKKHGLSPVLINNHKHAFNIVYINDIEYVVDLTAAQISSKLFPNEVEIRTWEDMHNTARETVKGKNFYSKKQRKNCFFAIGTIEEILTVNEDYKNDHIELLNILKMVINVEDLNVDTSFEVNVVNVNSLGKDIIQKLAA